MINIICHDTSYVFYTSEDGKDWNFVRHFSLDVKDTDIVKVGFTAQSPLADSLQVDFSEIRYKGQRFKNYWQGE